MKVGDKTEVIRMTLTYQVHNEWLTQTAPPAMSVLWCGDINKERAYRKEVEAIWHTWLKNNAAPQWNSVRLETKESITDYISCSGMDSTNKMEGSMPKCRTTLF